MRRSTEAAALAARFAVAVGASLAALARLEPELVGQNQVEIPHFAEVGVGDRGLRGVHCRCHRLPAWLIMSAYVR